MGVSIGLGVEIVPSVNVPSCSKLGCSKLGGYKFQVGMGGKTWKCVLIRVETATKPIETRHVLGWKS